MTTAQFVFTNAVDTPKSTQGVFELPCGYLDEKGVLHTEVEVSEMTGSEEDLFVSKHVPNHKKMGMLLQRCTKRIGSITDPAVVAKAVSELLIGDRTFLLFAIRRVTVLDDYPFDETCPSCSKKALYHVDLSQLDIKKMPSPLQRIYDVVLPSGKIARFRPLSGRDEERLASQDSEEAQISMAMLIRLELLDSKPPTLEDVKRLSWRDRDYLRRAFEQVEGGVETSIDMICKFCSHEWKSELGVTAGFFYPQRLSKSSKITFVTS